jgi:hypothetical protein
VSRKRSGRRADIVWVICSDPRHEPAYLRHGHHVVGTIGTERDGDGPGRLKWRGHLPASTDVVSTSGVTMNWPGIAPQLPVRERRRDDAESVWWLACICGRSPKVPESYLAEIIRRHAELRPGQPVEIDVVVLDEGRHHVR